jgi:hypothetical protein
MSSIPRIGAGYGMSESCASQVRKRAIGLMAAALRKQRVTGMEKFLSA